MRATTHTFGLSITIATLPISLPCRTKSRSKSLPSNGLRANLSPAEKAAIAERPTADPVAYAYYAKAREIDIYGNCREDAENEKAAKQKVELLEKSHAARSELRLGVCARFRESAI